VENRKEGKRKNKEENEWPRGRPLLV